MGHRRSSDRAPLGRTRGHEDASLSLIRKGELGGPSSRITSIHRGIRSGLYVPYDLLGNSFILPPFPSAQAMLNC